MDRSLYTDTSFEVSRLIARNYSTSFYSATALLAPALRTAVYGIYGFVRLADEIVDTFAGCRQREMLDRLEAEYETARQEGISPNPVVHAFAAVVLHYGIEDRSVRDFLSSMRADLHKQQYHEPGEIRKYIYGSADVVGLMCLRVFTDGDHTLYEQLKQPAMKLGSAFQKVNFLRDLKTDTATLGRSYFPLVTRYGLTDETKQAIIREIKTEFAEAYEGIRRLPASCRPAVYVAYVYYLQLLKKLEQTPVATLLLQRIRISDWSKMLLFAKSLMLCKSRFI